MTTVAFVGMTHLGLVSASVMAAHGFQTLCVDDRLDLIQDLRAGRLPVSEPDLEQQISSNGSRQSYSNQYSDLSVADVIYIAPDIPTDNTGQSDIAGVERMIDDVIPCLNPGAILIILSQVPPGFSREISKKFQNVFYQVETLVFGQAVQRAKEPERYIVGCASPDAELPVAFREVLSVGNCPVLQMRFESAELAKISINMCLVASVSVANTMAELCEQVGADWSEIAPSLKLDRRIGPYSYLSPGLGIAGGNLERDLATVVRLGDLHGTDTGVVTAQIANSQHRKSWAARIVHELGFQQSRLAVWGLAYKQDTHSIKNSPSLFTLSELDSADIVAHDPMVSADAVSVANLRRSDNPLDALTAADALLILTPWQQYKEVAAENIAARLRGKTVIDPYRVLDRQSAENAGLRYITLGVRI